MQEVHYKNRIALIDYIKALAIILVIMSHSLNEAGKESPIFSFTISMAVPIFVLISGFNFAASISSMVSLRDWYKWDRIKRKMCSYLCPMLCVFGIWLFIRIFRNNFSIGGMLKAFLLQSYGQGAYYFWIIVQLYLMFPLLYYLIKRLNGEGYCIIFFLTLLYEIVVYIFPIPASVYRIIAFRYMMHLALGILVYEKTMEEHPKIEKPKMLLAIFLLGCIYIGFFELHWQDTNIFRYTSWGNTNVFSCLYIAPVFYATFILLKNKSIRIKWIDNIISLIGQSSYYILCAQMVMFWVINRIWNWLGAPLLISMTGNIILSVVAGVCIYVFIKGYCPQEKFG